MSCDTINSVEEMINKMCEQQHCRENTSYPQPHNKRLVWSRYHITEFFYKSNPIVWVGSSDQSFSLVTHNILLRFREDSQEEICSNFLTSSGISALVSRKYHRLVVVCRSRRERSWEFPEERRRESQNQKHKQATATHHSHANLRQDPDWQDHHPGCGAL